jgi:hypothetical protein
MTKYKEDRMYNALRRAVNICDKDKKIIETVIIDDPLWIGEYSQIKNIPNAYYVCSPKRKSDISPYSGLTFTAGDIFCDDYEYYPNGVKSDNSVTEENQFFTITSENLPFSKMKQLMTIVS